MDKNNLQIKRNFYSNIGALLSNILIGIIYVPYLIDNLGLAAYGVIPLALILNQYISVLSGSLTSSLTRFYSVSLHQGKIKEASKNISTALLIIAAISVVCIGISILVVTNINFIFNISDEFINSAKILFTFTICSLSLSMFSSVLNVTIYAQNRLDLLNITKSLRIILKLLFTFIAFTTIGKDIAYFGIANFCAEAVILLLSIYFYRNHGGKKLKIDFKLFDKSIFSAIAGMTVWTIIHQLGDIGIYRIDVLSANKIWGLRESGALGAISEFNTYVMMIVSLISSLFGPLILKAYSEGKHTIVKELGINRSYICGIIAAVLSGTIAGYSIPILKIWINEEFTQYYLWLSIKMAIIPFYAAGGVLTFIYRSWNRVKAPAIVTLVLGATNIILIVFGAKVFNDEFSLDAIIVLCLVVGIIQSYFLNIYFVNKIYKGIYKTFILSSIKFSIMFTIALLVGKLSDMAFTSTNLLQLFLVIGTSTIFVSGIAYFVFLNAHHRKQLIDIIK